jgi:hypothetical protein
MNKKHNDLVPFNLTNKVKFKDQKAINKKRQEEREKKINNLRARSSMN